MTSQTSWQDVLIPQPGFPLTGTLAGISPFNNRHRKQSHSLRPRSASPSLPFGPTFEQTGLESAPTLKLDGEEPAEPVVEPPVKPNGVEPPIKPNVVEPPVKPQVDTTIKPKVDTTIKPHVDTTIKPHVDTTIKP